MNRTSEWADVMITAHPVGIRATSSISFGPIDGPVSCANHYAVPHEIQRRLGGFIEFIPLPFGHMGSPIHLQGRSRPGVMRDEVVLVHAVAGIGFDGLLESIQASWVKPGLEGDSHLRYTRCNDMGGTPMNESISRASGAAHGQEVTGVSLRPSSGHVGAFPPAATPSMKSSGPRQRVH